MTKENWKKKYEELYKKYDDYRDKHNWNTKQKWLWSVIVVFFTCTLMVSILFYIGVFENPIEKLNLEDDLASKHVLKYYPEFENCSIQYDECAGSGNFCKKGVEIYCSGLEDRDGLRTQRDKHPTEVLYFDDITLKDILIEELK